MNFIFYFLIFAFGSIVGSFLNVLILRHKTGINLFGRSFCFSCNKQLSVRDLFPIISFWSLRGKCRFCKSKISRQYILVEAATGFLFMLAAWRLGGPETLFWVIDGKEAFGLIILEFLYILTVFSLLLCIVVYDIKHKIIPDVFVYGFIALSLARVILFPQTVSFTPSAWDVFAGILLASPLAFLWLVTRGRGIGLGDATLMLGIGWFLGIHAGFAALVLAFWIGAIIGLLLVGVQKFHNSGFFDKKITMKTEIPFAPFLVLGFFLSFAFPGLATFVTSLFF